MKRASISEAKNNLSALLDRVKAGESVVILDRGVPVASLEPVARFEDMDERLAALARKGIVKLGTGKLPPDFLTKPLPKTTDGSSVVEALIEERRSGR